MKIKLTRFLSHLYKAQEHFCILCIGTMIADTTAQEEVVAGREATTSRQEIIMTLADRSMMHSDHTMTPPGPYPTVIRTRLSASALIVSEVPVEEESTSGVMR